MYRLYMIYDFVWLWMLLQMSEVFKAPCVCSVVCTTWSFWIMGPVAKKENNNSMMNIIRNSRLQSLDVLNTSLFGRCTLPSSAISVVGGRTTCRWIAPVVWAQAFSLELIWATESPNWYPQDIFGYMCWLQKSISALCQAAGNRTDFASFIGGAFLEVLTAGRGPMPLGIMAMKVTDSRILAYLVYCIPIIQ